MHYYFVHRGAQVYPRACGGTHTIRQMPSGYEGLSPRVRGNPASKSSSEAVPNLYPRACGGTLPNIVTRRLPSGLSPRVRGNPENAYALPTTAGSIPARAGEPGWHWAFWAL